MNLSFTDLVLVLSLSWGKLAIKCVFLSHYSFNYLTSSSMITLWLLFWRRDWNGERKPTTPFLASTSFMVRFLQTFRYLCLPKALVVKHNFKNRPLIPWFRHTTIPFLLDPSLALFPALHQQREFQHAYRRIRNLLRILGSIRGIYPQSHGCWFFE